LLHSTQSFQPFQKPFIQQRQRDGTDVPMIPTPDLSHLTKEDYKRVYEPAEDTFVLLDALEADADAIRDLAPKICLEIGSGTGIVSTFLAQIVGASNAFFICTDINPHAATCTARTGSQNKIPIEPLVATLARPLTSRLGHAVDILVFNPPYVPTSDDEADAAQRGAGIAGSWAGGADGMQVTDALLRQVDVGGFCIGVPLITPTHPHRVSIGSALPPGTILPGLCEAK